MKKVIRLTESDLHRIVKNSVKRILKEENDFSDKEEYDFYDFVNLLDENGWGYHNYQDVISKDGREGTRFTLSTNGKHTDFETLKNKILSFFPDAVFGNAQHRYAPEIKYATVIIFDI